MMLTQMLLPLLKKPRGQVVFINSSAGLTARPDVGYFSATQHAFKALADSLRCEVNADGVRVLSVYPGRTATPRIQALHAKEGRPYQPGSCSSRTILRASSSTPSLFRGPPR